MQFLGIFFILGMVLELSTLFFMVNWLGGLATLVLMALGMFSGGALLRNNLGVAKVMMAGQFLRGGGMSLYDMLLPVRIPLAGVLLAVPTGFLSSLIGLALLIPFKGKPAASAHGHQHFSTGGGFQYTAPPKHDGDVIEGEYTVKSSPHNRPAEDIIEHRK